MAEQDTTVVAKPIPPEDSKFFGASVRAWLVMVLVGSIALTHVAVCIGVVVDAILTRDWSRVGTFANVGEPLYSLSIAATAFYYGSNNKKTQ